MSCKDCMCKESVYSEGCDCFTSDLAEANAAAEEQKEKERREAEEWGKAFAEELKKGVTIKMVDNVNVGEGCDTDPEIKQEEVNEAVAAFDPAPKTAKERLAVEIKDLSEKIDKLSSFLKRRNEDGVRVIVEQRLTDAAVYLLHHQLEVMQEYYNVL